MRQARICQNVRCTGNKRVGENEGKHKMKMDFSLNKGKSRGLKYRIYLKSFVILIFE